MIPTLAIDTEVSSLQNHPIIDSNPLLPWFLAMLSRDCLDGLLDLVSHGESKLCQDEISTVYYAASRECAILSEQKAWILAFGSFDFLDCPQTGMIQEMF
jgi:hypothetical protein